VTCNILHSGGRTPSRDEVKKLIAKELGKNEELISVEYVSSTYGKMKVPFMQKYTTIKKAWV